MEPSVPGEDATQLENSLQPRVLELKQTDAVLIALLLYFFLVWLPRHIIAVIRRRKLAARALKRKDT
ncbi:hypothetical protein CYMTET_54040 [Cymbomonas tetramitiformis]|uniref:Uncharacterized protein n=1 Tax=Cymbomonas tetramitiformis TaxID=36881 RepID=A0AAE0EPG5_9CHLO|nr:hypothetical protein CYMTET_54040 [Cymbomonas tetramitiformis]